MLSSIPPSCTYVLVADLPSRPLPWARIARTCPRYVPQFIDIQRRSSHAYALGCLHDRNFRHIGRHGRKWIPIPRPVHGRSSNPETGAPAMPSSPGPQRLSKLITPPLTIAGASLPYSAPEINGVRQSSTTATEPKPLCVVKEPMPLPLPSGPLHGKTYTSAASPQPVNIARQFDISY